MPSQSRKRRVRMPSTSFTSVTDRDKEATKALASHLGVTLREIHAMAVQALQTDLRAIDPERTFPWQASVGGGGSPYTVHLPAELIAALRRLADRHKVS